jgi:hypothetical protein
MPLARAAPNCLFLMRYRNRMEPAVFLFSQMIYRKRECRDPSFGEWDHPGKWELFPRKIRGSPIDRIDQAGYIDGGMMAEFPSASRSSLRNEADRDHGNDRR